MMIFSWRQGGFLVPAVCLLALSMLPGGPLFAAGQGEPAVVEEQTAAANWQYLEVLVDTIAETRRQLAATRKALYRTSDEAEKKRLTAEVRQLSADLESLQMAWEMMATGGVDLQLFAVEKKESFNWRDELQSVFEPVLLELKKLTDRPRRIERLRNEQDYYRQRLAAAESALASVGEYRRQAPSESLQQAFARLQQRWQKRRDQFRARLELIEFELQELFAPAKGSQANPWETLKHLLSGRVLNLGLGLGAMLLVYLLLRALAWATGRIWRREGPRYRSFWRRLWDLGYHLLTILVVVLAGLGSFYLLGDWLLMGLFIILLVGAAWAVERSLPNYLAEARLMLNLGSVREGERIVYQELPWQVARLGYFTTLVNPLLEGGELVIPLRELVAYHSRRFSEGEAWFPSRRGDFVILADGTYGQVLAQTPELVQLQSRHAIKTYRAADFIGQCPHNLSLQGFSLLMTFGLDYRHQPEITGRILELFTIALEEGLSPLPASQYQTGMRVEFEAAAASSLDLLVTVTYKGEAAGQYFSLQRRLQAIAVDACNRHGWVIPFNQITVHRA